MFFGNSRVTFLNNFATLCKSLDSTYYVIAIVEEAVPNYAADDNANLAGENWESDVEYWNQHAGYLGGNVNCASLVFDVERICSGEPPNVFCSPEPIWPENDPTASKPPMGEESIVKIFRPNETNQDLFLDKFIETVEIKWGSEIWDFLRNESKKLILVVQDNVEFSPANGQCCKQLLIPFLDSFQNFLNEREVSHSILDICSNDKWLAWMTNAHIMGSGFTSDDCNITICGRGRSCLYRCTDGDCGMEFQYCTSSCSEPCPECNENAFCSYGGLDGGTVPQGCRSCEVIEGDCGPGPFFTRVECYCQDSALLVVGPPCASWPCDWVPGPSGGFRYIPHRCVECQYLIPSTDNYWLEKDYDQATDDDIDPNGHTCGIIGCGLTPGFDFGGPTYIQSSNLWKWIGGSTGAVIATTQNGPMGFYSNVSDIQGGSINNYIPCPPINASGGDLWKINYCGGCTGRFDCLERMLGPDMYIDNDWFNKREFSGFVQNLCSLPGCNV